MPRRWRVDVDRHDPARLFRQPGRKVTPAGSDFEDGSHVRGVHAAADSVGGQSSPDAICSWIAAVLHKSGSGGGEVQVTAHETA